MTELKELKLFWAQIETWGSPISISAYDENDAEGLTRLLFKIPSHIKIKVTSQEKERIL